MTINLAPPNTVLTINGIDYSAYLREVTGSYSAISESGLVVKTGSVVLAADPIGWPRITDSFPIGSRIQISDTNGPIQVMGNSYLEHAAVDERGEYITLTTSCILGIKNNATPGDLGACVNLRAGSTTGSLVNRLLSSLGIAATVPFLGSLVREPITFDSNGSLLKKAAEMSFANGYFLFESADGQVLFKSYKMGDTIWNINSRDTVRFVKNYDGDLPPKQVRVNTGKATYSDEGDSYTLVDNNTTTTYNVDRDSRTITTTQKQVGNLSDFVGEDLLAASGGIGGIYQRETFTVETFERVKRGFNPQAASFGNCIPIDEGRLLRRVTWTNEVKGVVLAEYYRVALEADPEYSPEIISLIESDRVEEIYTYNTRPIGLPTLVNVNSGQVTSTSTTPQSVTKIVRKYKPQGALVPFTGDPTFGRTDSATTFVSNPADRIEYSQEKTIWRKAPSSQTWSCNSKLFESAILRNSQGFSLSAKGSAPQGNVVSQAVQLTFIDSESRREEPPLTRFPPVAAPTIKPITYFGNYPLTGPINKRLDYSVDPIFATSATRDLVAAMGNIAWGRYYGYLIATRAYGSPILQPLSVCQVDLKTFAVDSLSVTLNSKEYFIGWRGIWKNNGIEIATELEFTEQVEIDGLNPVVIFGFTDENENFICL